MIKTREISEATEACVALLFRTLVATKELCPQIEFPLILPDTLFGPHSQFLLDIKTLAFLSQQIEQEFHPLNQIHFCEQFTFCFIGKVNVVTDDVSQAIAILTISSKHLPHLRRVVRISFEDSTGQSISPIQVLPGRLSIVFTSDL